MAEKATSQQTEQNNWLTTGRTRRLKWSSEMISDLLECKREPRNWRLRRKQPGMGTAGRKDT